MYLACNVLNGHTSLDEWVHVKRLAELVDGNTDPP